MNYLKVEVFRPEKDTSNNGVSSPGKFKYHFIPCIDGPISPLAAMRLVEDRKAVIYDYDTEGKGARLTLMFHPRTTELRGKFGGNFLWSSDDRFQKLFGNFPIKIYDRTGC